MAYSPARNSAPVATRDESWKALGFLNLYFPTRDLGRKKIGALPLRANKATEKSVFDWLNADATRIDKLLPMLVVEFRLTDDGSSSPFALPEHVAPAVRTQAVDPSTAQGYLNFYLPTADGGQTKLGAIGLRASMPTEKQWLDWLTAEPAGIEVVKAKLIVEYKSAAPTASTRVLLPA